MATQSPFFCWAVWSSARSRPYNHRAWFVSETQQRVVLFLNHIVMQEPQAMERLVRQKGRMASVQWRQFRMALVVTPAGLLESGGREGAQPDSAAGNHRHQSFGFGPGRLARRQAGHCALKVMCNWPPISTGWSTTWSWDVEEDLARVIGDVPAHTLANWPGHAYANLWQAAASQPSWVARCRERQQSRRHETLFRGCTIVWVVLRYGLG